jgi:hypothetical protein
MPFTKMPFGLHIIRKLFFYNIWSTDIDVLEIGILHYTNILSGSNIYGLGVRCMWVM